MSKIEVDKIDPQSGTALEVGTSGDTVTVPSGVGLTLTDSTLLLPTTITSTTEVKTNKISPATGTAFALGDSGDTFTVPSGATIVNSGTATGFGGGKVLQVISSTNSYQKSTTSTSFVDVESSSSVVWETAITPSATGSKILILGSLPINITGGTNVDNRCYSNVSGKVGAGAYSALVNYQRGGSYTYGSYYVSTSDVIPFNYLWTSNTTDECKVKFQFSSYSSASATVYVPALSTQSMVVTLMEIGA